jgi:hypothetical protein
VARDNTAVYHADPVTETAASARPLHPEGTGLGVLHFEFSTTRTRPPLIWGDLSVIFADRNSLIHHGVDLLLSRAHADDRFRVLNAFEQTLAGGPPLDLSFRVQCPVSLACRSVHVRAQFHPDLAAPESGTIRGVLIELRGMQDDSPHGLKPLEAFIECTVLLLNPALHLVSIIGNSSLFEAVFDMSADEALSQSPHQVLPFATEGTPLHELCRLVCEGALSRGKEPEVRFWRSARNFIELRGVFIDHTGLIALSLHDHSIRRRLARESRIGNHRANLLACIKSLHHLVTQLLGSEYLRNNGRKSETAARRLDTATRLLKLLGVTADHPEHLPNSPFEVLLWSCHRYVCKVVDSPRLSFDTSLLRLRSVSGALRIDQVVAVLSGLQECGAQWIEFSCAVAPDGEACSLQARVRTQEAVDLNRVRHPVPFRRFPRVRHERRRVSAHGVRRPAALSNPYRALPPVNQ